MNGSLNNEEIQQVAAIFSMSLKNCISDIMKQEMAWDKRKAVGINELCEIFGIERTTMLKICGEKESPAFKNGTMRSRWLCFPDQMHQYLLKKSIKFKS